MLVALATTQRLVGCQSFQQLGETLSELSSGCDYYNGDRKSQTRVRLICGEGKKRAALLLLYGVAVNYKRHITCAKDPFSGSELQEEKRTTAARSQGAQIGGKLKDTFIALLQSFANIRSMISFVSA